MSRIPSIKSAVKTIASLFPGGIKTAADPEVAKQIESVQNEPGRLASKLAIHKTWIRNSTVLDAVIGRKGAMALMAANNAKTVEQKNAVAEAELRQRGIQVFGETSESTPAPVAKLPEIPAQVPAPIAPAVKVAVEAVAEAPLTASAETFSRMSASEIETFSRHGGTISVSEFKQLKPAAKLALCKANIKITEEAVEKPKFDPTPGPSASAFMSRPGSESEGGLTRTHFTLNGATITRAEYVKLSPAAQLAWFKNGGGPVVD